jgi:hypothetical protein
MRFLKYLRRFTYTPNEFYDHLIGLEDAAGGDVDLVVLPAMTGEGGNEAAVKVAAAKAKGTVVPVTLQLMDKTKSRVHAWYNGKLEVKVDKTSTSGTIAIDDGDQGDDATFNLAFENGVGTFEVTLDGTWAANDTIKVTVDDDDTKIMGYSIEKNNHYLLQVTA